MALGPFTTGRSGSNSSWMGSRHGVAEAAPGTLKASAFSGATGVTNGIVPSGYPIMLDGAGLYIPFTGTDGTKLRFSIDDRDIRNGDETTAVLRHGVIAVSKLPIAFTPPTGASAFVFD